MNRRWPAVLGLVLAGMMTLAAVALAVHDPRAVAEPGQPSAAALSACSLSYFLLGALLVLRRPHLVIPWLLIVVGLCWAWASLSASIRLDRL